MEQVDYKELKKGGFMRQVQPDHFSMRLRVVGGQIKSEQLRAVSEISQKYGQGYVHMTSRQGIEIPYIKLQDIETAKQELAQAGLQTGACGARVRTITACQGSAVCPSGLIDTTALAGILPGTCPINSSLALPVAVIIVLKPKKTTWALRAD